MKKTFIGPILGVLGAAIIAAIFIYFYVSLNRMDKSIMSLQNAIISNSNKTAEIVNFFNSNLNAQAAK